MVGTVYVDEDIRRLIETSVVNSNEAIDDIQVQPSSLDLRCGFGKKIWHMPYSSIPVGNVVDFLDSESTHHFALSETRFLHKRAVYVIELEESLALPEIILAKSNPKSTTGRLDTHTRLITEDGQGFEDVTLGYNGRLFLELVSNSLDLFVPPGFSFNQIRFFNHYGKRLDQGMLEYLARSEPLLLDENKNPIDASKFIRQGAVYLTPDLTKPVYKLRDDAPPLNLALGKESHLASRYFEEVKPGREGLVTNPGVFYLLRSKEIVRIPKDHCAEMADVLTSLGEFRAHYAGFFDPHFYDFATMEYRNTGTTPFLLRHGKPITSLHFYRLNQTPKVPYGEERGSSYTGGKVIANIFY